MISRLGHSQQSLCVLYEIRWSAVRPSMYVTLFLVFNHGTIDLGSPQGTWWRRQRYINLYEKEYDVLFLSRIFFSTSSDDGHVMRESFYADMSIDVSSAVALAYTFSRARYSRANGHPSPNLRKHCIMFSRLTLIISSPASRSTQ